MIAATTTGFDVLERLTAAGYEAKLEGGTIMARPAPLPEELRMLVKDNRTAVKAALLLADPPGWLERVMNSAEKPRSNADSSVSSVRRRSLVSRIRKPFLSEFITASREALRALVERP